MICTIETETGSIYELNEAEKLIRWISGPSSTPRLHPEGVWVSYDSVSYEPNGFLLIVWEYADEIGKRTITSSIVKISIDK